MSIFNPDIFGWPQWTLLILLTIGSVAGMARHGKNKEPDTYNGFVYLFRFCFLMFLLTFGGFFA